MVSARYRTPLSAPGRRPYRCSTIRAEGFARAVFGQYITMRVHPNPVPALPADIRPPAAPTRQSGSVGTTGVSGDSGSSENIATTGLAAKPSAAPGNTETPRLADTGSSASIGGPVSQGESRDQGNSVSNDSVSVSGPAAFLSQLSGEHAQRLESLSTAVKGGSYAPSGSAIAGAIVSAATS